MAEQEITIDYNPQPLQRRLHTCTANEILFGGAAGPGKSHGLRMEGLIWASRIRGLQVYLFRRTFPELEKNHILPVLSTFPHGLGVYRDQKRRYDLHNGSMIHFSHCQYEKDVFNYQGAEIHLLLIDELTTFTEFQYDYLRGRVRCTLQVPEKYQCRIPGIITASNPGGVGHNFVKSRWVDFAAPLELKQAEKKEGGMTRCFIPGKLEDNKILLDRDPEYVHRLDALPEPYRTAYKDGNWNIFMGQAFAFRYDQHVIKPLPIPEHAQKYMTFDWGFGKPYSVGYWWVDTEGRGYRFSEIYGCLQGQPDTGLRQTDDEIAENIKKHESKIGISNQSIIRLCGPDCFSKKPDYKGGGQGPSTAETFAKHGLIMSPGDPSRILKIRQFHARLRLFNDQPPMMLVYDTCLDFIRTIPLLQTDPNNMEDIDTRMEDHQFDEAAHFVMARPIAMALPVEKKNKYEQRIELLEKGYDDPNEVIDFGQSVDPYSTPEQMVMWE